MKIAIVYGCRPEAIKLAPVVEELRRRGVEPIITSTGQHTSLLKGTPADGVMAPHVSLNLPSANNPLAYAEQCGVALQMRWRYTRAPDVVVVQGDTASAYAGAWAANEREIPVAHVEAGIRSGDLNDPWPEEEFRVWIDQSAKWLFAPTQLAAGCVQLYALRGGRPDAMVAVTGNPGIDALYAHTPPSKDVEDRVLITLHRRESFGEPLRHLVAGIVAGSWQHPFLDFVWPTHPNPRVQEAIPSGSPNLTFCAPLPAVEFARTLAQSRAVITDSGGVQEEAAALGIPCIIAREKTDRPESVEIGLAKVVGRTEHGILDGLDWALGFAKRPDPSHCFGDGHAAPRIVDHLLG